MINKFLRNNIFTTLALLSILPFASCDDMDEAERITAGKPETIVVQPETLTVVAEGETFTYVDEHRLLIEDFTGWNCVNCPNIADFLTSQVTNNYPSVLVSLHMTTNSFSANHPDGYNCASADSIANMIYGSTVASQMPLPSVSIDQANSEDGVTSSNTTVLGKLALERFTACNITKTAPQAGIAVNVAEKGDNTYSISTLVNYKGASSCNLKLWLIEEGLISRIQNSTSGYLRDYENHGILRQVINGSYEGQNITLNAEGQAVVHTNLNLSGKNYVAQNCRVVAIITDANGVVVNCNEKELK